jgi:hypothetical protein
VVGCHHWADSLTDRQSFLSDLNLFRSFGKDRPVKRRRSLLRGLLAGATRSLDRHALKPEHRKAREEEAYVL